MSADNLSSAHLARQVRPVDWMAFGAMAVGMFLAILDIQIVASSLVDIEISLRIPPERLSYLQTTYLIAEVIAIALSGVLARALSIRWLFVAGLCGFVLGSLGCAAAPDYQVLYAWRIVQGLFGGVLIPTVFSAAILMFPSPQQSWAILIGGGLAMLAPTLGPLLGGWITETLSWRWLFLVNIAPGLLAAGAVAALGVPEELRLGLLKRVDLPGACLCAVFLTTLEIFLKEAPRAGWTGVSILALGLCCCVSGLLMARRFLRQSDPILLLPLFRDSSFAVAATLSFVLGMALFGATYLLPLYLGIVRGHEPLEIGTIMLVSGATQLVSAPVATAADNRMPPRVLAAAGYALFAAGLAANALATPAWDGPQLVAPQILRGAAVLLCLLPTTRLALGQLRPELVAHGSSLFNLMRNIGGAVGLALIDTVIETRPAHHVARIVARLQAGDRTMAAFVGLPLDRFHGQPMDPVDAATRQILEPLVNRAAATASFNDAWLLLAVLVALSLPALLIQPKAPRETGS